MILFVDACRSQTGRRDGLGVGQELQKGVITFFACRSEQSSYEIDELGHGAFTHALLESLQIEGNGNCATVERLNQRLCRTVPELNRRYQKPLQHPYGTIEPLSKNCFILLPKRAQLADVVALKFAASNAEIKREYGLAKQLRIRDLAASPADDDAIAGIERLTRVSAVQTPTVAPPESHSGRGAEVEVSPVEPPKSATKLPVVSFEVITVDAKGSKTERKQCEARLECSSY